MAVQLRQWKHSGEIFACDLACGTIGPTLDSSELSEPLDAYEMDGFVDDVDNILEGSTVYRDEAMDFGF